MPEQATGEPSTRGQRIRRSPARALRFLMFAVTGSVLTAIVLGAYAADVFRDSELDTVDARFSIRGDQDPPEDIVVVAIDDVTFNELQQRWPFPRSLHARVIDRLSDAGAKVIAYDVQFTEPSEDPDEDNALIESVGRAKNVLLGTEDVGRDGSHERARRRRRARGVRSGGRQRRLPERPGRRAPADVPRRPRAEDDGRARGGEVQRPQDRARQLRRGGRDDLGGLRRAAAHRRDGPLLDGSTTARSPASMLRGKIVIVGPASPSLQDVHPTSSSGEDLMAGAEIQANSAATGARGLPAERGPRRCRTCC